MDRDQLVKLLEDSETHLENKQIVMWGMGNTAELYQEVIAQLEEEGLNIVGYTASWYEARAGETEYFHGKPIISLQDIKNIDAVFVVVCSMNPVWTVEIEQELGKLGVEGASIDKVVFSRHREEVLACYDMLEDAESKRTYAELIKARINVVNPPEDIICPDQYYVFTSNSDENEIMVECGGFIGDTLEAYVRKKRGKFARIISFEPDINNMSKMKERVKKVQMEFGLADDKIRLIPYAVGDEEKNVYITCSKQGNLSRIFEKDMCGENSEEKSEAVKQVTLDNYIDFPYSFLKMDVEGYEEQIIRGAKKGIECNKPMLAVCIYHNAMHFYRLPLLIKEMVPEYKLAVRHHLKTLSETVVYAYITVG